jgi:hypothetical protein
MVPHTVAPQGITGTPSTTTSRVTVNGSLELAFVVRELMATSVINCNGVSSSTVMALPVAKRVASAFSDEEEDDSPLAASGELLRREAAG